MIFQNIEKFFDIFIIKTNCNHKFQKIIVIVMEKRLCEFCSKWVNRMDKHNKTCKIRELFVNPPLYFFQLLSKNNLLPNTDEKDVLSEKNKKSQLMDQNKELKKNICFYEDIIKQYRSVFNEYPKYRKILKQMDSGFSLQLELYKEYHFPNLYLDFSKKRFFMKKTIKKKLYKMMKPFSFITNLEDFMSMKSDWYQLLHDKNVVHSKDKLVSKKINEKAITLNKNIEDYYSDEKYYYSLIKNDDLKEDIIKYRDLAEYENEK